MSDQDRQRFPDELSEMRAIDLAAECARDLPAAAGAFLAALRCLELKALLLQSAELKVDLSQRVTRGRAGYGARTQTLMAGALVERLEGLLGVHLRLSPTLVAVSQGSEAELERLARDATVTL